MVFLVLCCVSRVVEFDNERNHLLLLYKRQIRVAEALLSVAQSGSGLMNMSREKLQAHIEKIEQRPTENKAIIKLKAALTEVKTIAAGYETALGKEK